MKTVKYCKDCRHSRVHGDEPKLQILYCVNPMVIPQSEWELASPSPWGEKCANERRRTGFSAVCGAKGKRWEAKESDS